MAIFTAKTTAGVVRGVISGIPSTVVYRSIPFAEAKRFAPPQPPTPWEGERLCGVFGPIQPQQQLCQLREAVPGLAFANFFCKEQYPVEYPIAENPLTLTVWTPAKTRDERLPVMVWIHGGGMATGFDYEMEFDGEALSKRGVILVSINYRLAVLGHFAHPELSRRSEHGVSGNWSILDQQAALRWVRDNIKEFGGDPGNVTIFGQSAGGGSVLSHLCSPLSRGLFHHAIIQSGAGVLSYSRNVTLETAESWGVKACEILGKTVDELTEMPLEELMAAMDYAESHGAGQCPRQCCDGYIFPEDIATQLRSGNIADVDVIVGSNNGDVGLFSGDPALPRPERLAAQYYGPRASAFLSAYPAEKRADAYDALEQAGTTFHDAVLCQTLARKHPARLYFFHPYIPGGDEFGFIPDGEAYHCAELWFVFGTLQRCWRPFNGKHYDLSQQMMDYWTNFAKTGDPNGPNLPAWPAYTEKAPCAMDITEEKCEAVPTAPLRAELAAF